MVSSVIIDQCQKLRNLQTVEKYYHCFDHVTRQLGFNKCAYAAVPITNNQVTKNNFLSYYDTYGANIMSSYKKHNFFLIDPCIQYLLQQIHHDKPLIWSFNGFKTAMGFLNKHNEINIEILNNLLNKHRLINYDFFASYNISDSTVTYKNLTNIIDLCSSLKQGITIPIYNHLFTKGIGCVAFDGTANEFKKFYSSRKHNDLLFFLHSFHQQLQTRFSNHFIDHLKPNLTSREISILNYLAWGNTNDQITAKLNISFSTVRTHINHILLKLRASNATHACVIGLNLGFIK